MKVGAVLESFQIDYLKLLNFSISQLSFFNVNILLADHWDQSKKIHTC